MTVKKVILNILYYAAAISLALVFIFPFLIMLAGSLDSETKYIISISSWIPKAIDFNGYINMFSMGSAILKWIWNSVIISAVPTLTGVFIAALLGYIFAKKKFRFKETVFWFFMMAVMVPYQALIVSNYMVYNYLDWINKYIVFLVPGLWTVIYMFMMRQFLTTIPDSLIEAAKIDGGGEWKIFFQIILPLSKPSLCTVAIFTFMDKWNDFMGPLLFTTDEGMYNLVVGLSTMIQKNSTIKTQMCIGVITFIPIFIVYLALQKYFIDGIATTGVKG